MKWTRNRSALGLQVRLERMVSPEPNTGCWLWTGATVPFGYGRINGGRTGVGVLLAHRASWEIYRGPVPEELCVLHRCDIPQCVNPDHLFLGTHADNVADKIAKGRARFGTSGMEAKTASRRAQTHCKRGHLLSGENLIPSAVHRECKTCAKANSKLRHSEKLVAAIRSRIRSP